MKKFFALSLALIACACLLPAASFAEEAAPAADITINVYNWGQYISDGSDGAIDVNAAFTEATGIKVNYTTFDSNETLYTKLKTGGSSYDVIIPSDYMTARLINEGMLEKLDFGNIPNYANIDASYKDQDFDPENEYSVPYTWGTVGIIYNTKYVKEAPTSWDILWDKQYSGKILMFDNPRDAFAITEYMLGYSVNTTDAGELEACADKLKEQKPLVQNYVMDQIYDKMINEEAYVAPYYAGDYLQMAVDNENLAFCFPKEGFNIFIDSMCIPKGSQNKAAAEAYINFLCDPEVSGQNLDFLGYSTPISAAKEYIDADTASSEIAYPTQDVLKRATAFSFLDTSVTQKMDSLWTSVKTDAQASGGNQYLGAIIGVCVVVAALVVFFVFRAVSKKKRLRERGN